MWQGFWLAFISWARCLYTDPSHIASSPFSFAFSTYPYHQVQSMPCRVIVELVLSLPWQLPARDRWSDPVNSKWPGPGLKGQLCYEKTSSRLLVTTVPLTILNQVLVPLLSAGDRFSCQVHSSTAALFLLPSLQLKSPAICPPPCSAIVLAAQLRSSASSSYDCIQLWNAS